MKNKSESGFQDLLNSFDSKNNKELEDEINTTMDILYPLLLKDVTDMTTIVILTAAVTNPDAEDLCSAIASVGFFAVMKYRDFLIQNGFDPTEIEKKIPQADNASNN